MAGLSRLIMNTVKAGLSAIGVQDNDSPANSPPFTKAAVKDVLTVKALLQTRGKLPIELVDCIIDYAEYWPQTTTFTTSRVVASGSGQFENVFALRSLPLGYDDGDLEKNDFSIPLEEYLEIPAETDLHYLETLDLSRTVTEDILNHWTEKSQPRGENPCRKIVFTIRSADQGWGGLSSQRGTYGGSYTWLDVGKEYIEIINKDETDAQMLSLHDEHYCELGRTEDIEATGPYCCILRPLDPALVEVANSSGEQRQDYSHPFLPSSTRLQSNRTATRDIKEHIVTWSYQDDVVPDSLEGDALETAGRGRASANGEYVRNLKIGDVVTVWARARFPGWRNNVEHIRIDVFWAV